MRTLLPRALAVAFALAPMSCGDDDSPDPGDVDSGGGGQPDAAGEPECYDNPTTHREIINACTDAEKIEKDPVLPLLEEDGSLPDLPPAPG
jgi:hypothetical protein